MFKIESYIAPILLKYVNKYIKNIKPEDLQLSLWGGDLVLNKLDLKLDVLEKELNVPISFVSGHIHELRIYVPWHKLIYEPVVVTINTIECVLKLRDSADGDHGSTSSMSSSSSKVKGERRSKVKQSGDEEDIPPSYVQTLINRVINNINIVVNNLILKYVEDDIVLSVNVKSVESFSVNSDWESAFIELAQPDLVLRRMCQLSDITACLDKRNASGKIEMYQEPLVYKCSVTCRMHMTFDSINAKRASVITINTLCDKLDISITDTQLPMYIRLHMLILALYYGDIAPGKGKDDEESVEEMESHGNEESAMAISKDPDSLQPDDEQDSQGWASWAWSYVPQLVMIEDEEELEEYQHGRRRKKAEPPVLVLGLYFTKSRVTFKLTDLKQDSPYYGPQKIVFNPFLYLEVDNASVEIVYKGDPFFNAQVGLTHIKVAGLGNCPCDVPDFQDGHHQQPFIVCGDPNFERKQQNYISGSMFDESWPEKSKQRTQFVFDVEEHQMKYSETNALQRFGAFWLDYIYTMEVKEEEGSRSSKHSDEMQYNNIKETSSKKFLFGPSTWHINSSGIHRVQKFICCANDHEYQPYSQPKPEIVDENRPVPSVDEVAALEEFIPTRSMHITALGVNITVSAAEHSRCDMKKKKTVLAKQRHSPRKQEPRRKSENPVTYQPVHPLPACQLQADRIDIQNTVPMYGRKLVKAVSKLPQPSGNLVHHCYSHMYIKVFGCQAGLTLIDPSIETQVVLNIFPSCSAAVYKKSMMLPMYWTNPAIVKLETLIEVPHLGFNMTRAQLSLLLNIYQSWLQRAPNPSQLLTNTLMDDVFKPSAKSFSCGQPILDAMVSNLELKYSANSAVKSTSGTLGSCMLAVQSLEGGKDTTTPLFYGPVDNNKVHKIDYYTSNQSTEDVTHKDYSPDFITLTVQIPIDKDSTEACGVCLVNVQGSSICIDPILYTWLTYQPREKIAPLLSKQDSCVTIATETTFGSKSQEQIQTSSQDSTHSGSLRLAKQSESHSQSRSQPLRSPSETTEDEKENKQSRDVMTMIVDVWSIIKQLTVQVEVQCCSIYLPSTHLQFNTDVHQYNIPQAFQAMVNNSDTSLPQTLVICLPTMKVNSAGHKPISPLQEIPLDRLDVPTETAGDKLPWSTSFTNFSCYTLLDSHRVYYIIKPMAVASTLAVSTVDSSPSGSRSSLGLCIHADMQAVVLNCSNKQVTLVYQLAALAMKSLKVVMVKKNETPSSSTSAQPSPNVTVTTSKPRTKTPPSATSSSAVEIDPAAGALLSTGETGTSTGFQTESLDEDTDKRTNQSTTKVSLWLQWTVPKLSVNLYGIETGNDKREMKICSELEDLSTSIDIQDIYSKVKCKIGSVNVNHYYHSSDCTWKPGMFNGVILSCTEKISQNTGVIKQQTDTEQTGLFKSPFATTPVKSQDSTGFLSMTFTRALAKSVRQKMFGMKSEKAMATRTRSCVNEICLNLQPYDVVLWCPVLTTAMEVFALQEAEELIHGQEVSGGQVPSIKSQRSEVTISTAPSESSVRKPVRTKKRKTAVEIISARNLPLLYLNMCDVRLFVPCGKAKPTPKRNFDTFLVQINSISMVPHADNPLSRLVLKKDIYRHAMHTGILQQPGSEVEDRQYQLDVTGMSLCAVLWEELTTSERGMGLVTPRSVVDDLMMGQNPALEWNTAVARKSPQGIHLNPIVLGYDIKVVAAPAIVCDKPTPDVSHTETVTVCGHSLEVNLTSDMEVFLSTEQFHLAQSVFETNINTLLKSRNTPQTSKSGGEKSEKTSLRSEDGRSSQMEDSGVGSECSTVFKIPISSSRKEKKQLFPPMATLHERPRLGKQVPFTPFDVLLTAGKLSVMLYSVDEQQFIHMSGDKKSTPSVENKDSETQKDSRPSDLKIHTSQTTKVQSPKTKSPRNGSEKKQKARESPKNLDLPGRVIKPFLYLMFSQPHTIVSMEMHQQRVEMSCYDFNVKGVSVNYENRDGAKILPEVSDFGIDWLETCHGEPDPKTGILPTLYTFCLQDFIFKPADVSLSIGRPLKFNLSITKMEQIMDFVKKLSPPKSTQINGKLSPMRETPTKGESKFDNEEQLDEATPKRAPPQSRSRESSESTPPQSGLSNSAGVHETFPLIIPMPSADGVSGAPSGNSIPGKKSKSQEAEDSLSLVEMVLTQLDKVSFQMCEFVVVMATVPDLLLPHVTFSLGSVAGEMVVKTRPSGVIQEVYAGVHLQEAMLKTSLQSKTRPLIGPINMTMNLNADWCSHSGSHQFPGLPQLGVNVNTGLVQIHFGQGHVNCLDLMMAHVRDYIKNTKEESKKKEVIVRSPVESESEESVVEMKAEDEIITSTDDLRVGTFQYINDKDGLNLQPQPNEIVFCGGRSTACHGTMTWCYNEPRVLTFVAVNPVPFTTSVGSDVRHHEENKKIPCNLEYWDNLKKDFIVYRQLYVSESFSYQVDIPDVKEVSSANQIVASQVWRVVLNAGKTRQEDNGNPGNDDEVGEDDDDDEFSDSLSSQEPPISPMALAACMRVDSCFAAKFVPALSASINVSLIQVKLSNHLQYTGQAQPKKLFPFEFDGTSPTDQEFMNWTLEGTSGYLNCWQGANNRTHVQMSSSVQCEILEYRNLTMQPLVEFFDLVGSVNIKENKIETCLQFDPVFVRIAQSTVHTLNTTLQSWTNNRKTDKEELLLNYYVICNDTQETLRLGQVATDEAIVLESRKMHGYSWRTHKSKQQLHVCIEGWGNWKWSDAFSIDEVGTTVHTLQHKGKNATLFVKVKNLSALQKQITISGQQYFASRLTKDIEVQLVKVANLGLKTMQNKQTLHLPAKRTLPSCIGDGDAITGVRVRLSDVSCDWSEQFAISGEMRRTNTMIKIPCTGGKHIYIWCQIYEEKHTFTEQRLIVFSPLFVVRSHLPRPVVMNVETTKTKSIRHFSVIEQGQNITLYDIEPEMWHYVTFQLSAEAALSHPPVSISTKQIGDLQKEDQRDTDIESLCYDWQSDLTDYWPYNDIDYNESDLKSLKVEGHKVKTPTTPDLPSQLPNIDLKVDLSQYWSVLNTVLIDIKPSYLLVNDTSLDLQILEEDELPLVIHPGSVITPQNFKSAISLSIHGYKSEAIELMKEAPPASRRYALLNKPEGVLPLDGFTHTSIVCGDKEQKVCYLTIASTVKQGIRVVTIKHRYLLINKSKEDLDMRTVELTYPNIKINRGDLNPNIKNIPACQSSTSPTVQPIEFWDLPSTSQFCPIKKPVQYISFTYANEEKSEPANQITRKWTQFVSLNPKEPRQSVAMPSRQPPIQSGEREDPLAIAVTYSLYHGVCYITVDRDNSPRVMIHNNCPFPLHYGQGLSAENKDDTDTVTVVEEQDRLSAIPVVEADSSVYYEFPSLRQQFPELTKQPGSIPNLHISMARSTDTLYVEMKMEGSMHQIQWTDGIDIGSSGNQKSEIMVLPHGGYTLVNCQTVGTCTHVFIELLTMEGHTGAKKPSMLKDVHKEGSDGETSLLVPECSVLASQVCIILADELHSPFQNIEVLRLSLDNLHLAYFPHTKPDHPNTTQQCVQLSVGSLQVDNQLFLGGNYDFPVILVAQDKAMSFRGSEDYFFMLLPSEKLAEKSYKTSLFAARLVFEMDNYRQASCLHEVSVSSKPLTIYMEDHLIYQMLKVIDSFRISHDPKHPIKSRFSPSHDQYQPMTWEDMPQVVKSLSTAMMSPIAVNHFHIQPITVLASVHASLKLYLASDHTPLSFGQFSHGPVFTTTRQLVQSLTMHYASGALFKAGWVLGSLEILGNPAGLVRSIGSGVADLFRLPYEGLIRGPSAFMTGVTGGASSLVKHVSTGTLTSITNFASSMARNMDRLSLDNDHLLRQEEHRRQIPERVSEGFKQGLSGFGISLLGAVAGVVDQPIKSWTKSSTPSTTTQKATGVISGVGRGLVGVVTKPLGGAAEFVSQTGQGILHGAGLTEIPKPRFAPCTEQVAMAANGHVKYVWKMLHSLPNATILMYLENTQVTYHGLHHSGCLLLTPEVLFVVSTSEDTQQQAFPVSEVTCHGKNSDSGVLCITLNQPITPSTAGKKETSNRVADFVDATSGHAAPNEEKGGSDIQSSDTTSEPCSHGNHVAMTTYKYLIDPRLRDSFIALFNQAKRRLEGKGFRSNDTEKVSGSPFQSWFNKAKEELEDETSM